MELPELSQLDLSPGQIQVYTAVLELGIATLNHIQEKVSLDRRNIYDILDRLMEKGLISYTQSKGGKVYQCTHPNKLKEEIQKKEEKLSDLKNKLPQIESLYNYSRPEIRAEVLRGNEALKSLLNEALNCPATYWIGGNSGVEQCSEEMHYWFKRWTKKRIELKKFMYDLVDYGTSLEDFKPNDLAKHKKSFYKYCQLPKNLSSPMVIILFGNKVAQVLWSKQSFAVVIESEEIKESFMRYFNYFWKEPD
ncbi:hypothetical protein HZC30_01050 [Candidatus Woesearchaeota archaeon]|nr:hypothetical protein [Candidatus Woesearchaeota archaeon]